MALGLLVAGCQKPEPEQTTTAPVLGDIAGATLAADGADISTTYQAADFGVSATISYALFVDKQGANLANKQQVTAKIGDGKVTVTQNNLNKALVNLVAAGSKVDAELVLYAYLGSTIDDKALVSNVVKASFTTFEPTTPSDIPDIDLSQYEYLDIMEGAETWGIIGPAVLDWNTDIDMEKISEDPEIWKAADIPFQEDKFKFRGNDEWADYDLGGGEYAFQTPIVLTKGGGDMVMDKAGSYTVFLYPTYGIAYFDEGSGNVPPPPAKPKAWSLIGTINGTSWDTDFDLENTHDNVWKIRNVAITESDEFKIRADHEWNKSVGGPEENETSIIDENDPYGVYKPELGVAFATGDTNIRIGVAGNYDVTYDYAAQTILIEEYKEVPDHLYMIGEAIGGWDWDADYIVDMAPVVNVPEWGADTPGQFYTIKYLPAGKGFKFCAKKAWDGDFWGLQENDGFTEEGGNCTVAEDGFYMIHVDMKRGMVHVEPARVFGIGDAFGGWTEDVEANQFVADGQTMKATVPTAGALRVYVASAIANSGWWTREFTILDGQIAYRVRDEYSWPEVKKGQVVTFNFNEGTGTIAGEGQEEEQQPYALIGWHANDSWSTNVDLIDVEGQPDWRVAKYIGANSGNIDFKFRRGTKWVPQIGATNKNPKNVNELFKLTEKTDGSEPDPANIHLDGNGVYDVYLNEKELTAFILEAGTAFAIPTTWESTDTPQMDWYIIGEAVGGWDNANDVPLLDEGGDAYVARNVTILGQKNFKFRANHAWTYQLTCPGMRTIGMTFDLEDGNGSDNDMQIPADGVYDVYLYKTLEQAVIKAAEGAPANLWNPTAVNFFMYMNIAADWSNPKYDNVGGAECPFCEISGTTYKLTFEDQTFDRWQNQFFMYPSEGHFIPLDASKTYSFSMTVESTESFGAFFKLAAYNPDGIDPPKHEGAAIWEPEGYPDNMILEAGKAMTIEHEFTGVDAPNINLIFDFGKNPAGTVVTIKDITLVEK